MFGGLGFVDATVSRILVRFMVICVCYCLLRLRILAVWVRCSGFGSLVGLGFLSLILVVPCIGLFCWVCVVAGFVFALWLCWFCWLRCICGLFIVPGVFSCWCFGVGCMFYEFGVWCFAWFGLQDFGFVCSGFGFWCNCSVMGFRNCEP